MRYAFRSTVVRWNSQEDSWYFAHVPVEESAEIAALPIPRRGFGSLRVRAQIGETTWKTSVFPNRDGRYSLPLKREVRTREGLEDGDPVSVTIELIELEP